MNRYTLGAIIILFAFIFPTPMFSMAGQWYIGGNLHEVSIGRWQRSTYENKLATAATWALMQPEVRKISSRSSSMNSVRPYAMELVSCMDRVSGKSGKNHITASNLAADCMVTMGW